MSAFLINKLSFEDTKQIMLSSMKTMASLHGILAIFLPIIAGGGLLTLIMKNVTMEGLAFLSYSQLYSPSTLRLSYADIKAQS